MLISCLNILREKLAGQAGGNVVAQKVSHIDRDASASRHVAGVCQGALFSKNTIKWLWAAILLNCLAPLPAISASNGDQIINRVTFYSAASLPETTAASVTIIVGENVTRTPSTVEFLKYSPGTPGTANLPVTTTYYSDASGSFSVVSPPVTVGSGTAIDLTAPLPLLPYELFHDGEPVFIRVTDLDQNIDRSKAETVTVTVSNSKTGDSEILRLTETGPDTGVFIGYIQLSYAATIVRNGVLSIVEDSSIHALYIDPVDGSDSSTDAALVDPFGLVFDTVTGKPVDGATVELLNADGTPATVYGDNGLTANLYPNAVLSGGIATDAEGNKYSFTPGGYRFPFIAPGSYILKITPPSSYSSPSTVSTSVIQTLPGAPFTIVEPGSRGEPFTVQAGPAIRIDIPLDPKAGTLWLSKVASRNIISAGDLLSYTINIENTDPVSTVSAAVVTDKLPPGFRYQKGSSRLNSQPLADPAVSADGSTLIFTIGTIEPKSSAIISYITAVGAGADPGMAVNTASVVTTPPVTSNVAEATVRVNELFMQSRNLIMGRVFVGTCSDNMEASKKGMGGIGIYLEDGTFVITDNLGMFHFEGVRPGPHVVQLDLDSIPEGYQIQPCEENSRFAGRAYSQFVDLQGGTMWRTDFYLSKTEQELATASVPAAENIAAPTPQPINPQQKSAPEATQTVQKASAAAGLVDKEQVELFSALHEGLVHYRIKLTGLKETPEKVTVTLVTPKSQLYLTDTSRLSGNKINEPETDEALIAYTIIPPTDEKKFDLRLQTLLEEDDQAEALTSSVTVVIADADGNPLKTFTATAELSDNMDDINKMDIPIAAGHSIAADDETNFSENIDEYVEKVAGTYKDGTAIAETADNGLHVNESEGILSPADGTILATQINAVRIVLNSGLTPVLTMDGNVIPADRIGFKMKDTKSDKSLYTYIGVDFGDAGEHVLQLKGVDTFGLARFDKSARISRSGEITSIRIVEVDGNIADGRTPVRVRVQLFDKDDKPVMANAELSLKGGDLRPLSASGNSGRDAGEGMVSVDSQGWITFKPVTSSGLYRAHIAYNKATLDIETYVKPKMRDWILVGIAEGTAGYNTVSGNMENLKGAGKDEHYYDNERLAFFAKGTIKGEWLLTMSYDSGKKSTGVTGNALFQNIDPNTYYTLYGDSTVQGYEAASQKKLYLKIERDQFYALYGDYDTGLTFTELSRYSRRLNGIKTEFRSRNFEVTAFGSETGQSFVKDELRGDGTSGLYRLSKTGIVLNSEKITIESRDRFHSEIVTDSRQMVRFIDYSIDYDSGALFFKGPISSKDELLNPVYIVVDYEIEDAGKDAQTYGGRASTRQLNGKLIVGGSYVHKGHVNGSNNLYGADAALTLGPGTQARAEIATTDSDSSQVKASGTAYLAEITHVGKKIDGRIYYREQESGFGLGQQKESEKGTRKFGAEGGYRLDNHITLTSQAYRQYNLLNDDIRDFIESLATYTDKQYSARAGMRYANDTLTDGSNKTSVLGTAGISWRTFNQRLTLRADHDQALFSNDNNVDFPTRTILGVDYQATKSIVVFAQEELTFGATEDTNTTRLGVRATPWSGGTVVSTVVNDIRENSDRTFATVGLAQKWQLNRFWTVDGGVDHTRTIQNKTSYQFNESVPPASGGDDFTAVSLGANYQKRKITWSNRVEYRNSDTDDKWGFITELINEHGLDWAWTGKLQLYHTQSGGGSSSTNGDLRLGLVYRPPVTKWIILNRLDLLGSDIKDATTSVAGQRIINNLHANFKPDKKTQLSIQYGAKYVFEEIDGRDYSGYTDLIAVEGRYDINKEWDIGLRGALLHTWETSQYSYNIGPSIGYNVMENAWVSLGYNFAGFEDKDFSAANYTADGPFVQFRFKFDQNSVKEGLKALNQ